VAKNLGGVTIKALAAMDIIAGNVERSIAYRGRVGHTKDLFGFIDLVAMDTEFSQLIGLQVTDITHISHRIKKIINDCHDHAVRWLRCDGRIEVWGWRGTREAKRMEIVIYDHDVLVQNQLMSYLEMLEAYDARKEAGESHG